MDTSFISRYWQAVDDLKGKKELSELAKAYVEAWKNAEVTHIGQLNSAKQNEKFTGKPFPFNSLENRLTNIDLDFKKLARSIASMHLSEEQLNKANPDIKSDDLDPNDERFIDKEFLAEKRAKEAAEIKAQQEQAKADALAKKEAEKEARFDRAARKMIERGTYDLDPEKDDQDMRQVNMVHMVRHYVNEYSDDPEAFRHHSQYYMNALKDEYGLSSEDVQARAQQLQAIETEEWEKLQQQQKHDLNQEDMDIKQEDMAEKIKEKQDQDSTEEYYVAALAKLRDRQKNKQHQR
jgi:hypothetical protein